MDERAADRPLRWGIAGPGRMAQAFVKDFAHVDGAVPYAVGSRDVARAQAFADEFGLERAFGSYAELCACPEIDVVYIATPHPQHKAIALEAIGNGKAVLVEKAFATTLAGAQEIVDAARAQQVFAMEAMWTRFQPVVRALHDVVDAGQLGTILGVQGDLYAQRDFNPDDRLFAKDLGGGALLDLGVYVLQFAQDFLGSPSEMTVRGTLYPNGVDAQAGMVLSYDSGALATLAVSLQSMGPGRMVVMGDQGWAEVKPRFHHPDRVVVHRKGVTPRTLALHPDGTGYSHEIVEVNRALREGRLESDIMPLSDTLAVMDQLEQALHAVGVKHPDQPL
ncbi:Gfo/Idh/MocA family protein [Luteococcus sp. Sow4_B9]|uniref:Gfo/Idh/MocA family protein n=1 Tax=Luteococcus sp. Sow4_B9 TaxID=3438792 RepID=UPI003F9A8FB3